MALSRQLSEGPRSWLSQGFGRYFTDHMVTISWTTERGWHDARVGPYRPFTVDPAAAVLQYGLAVFEGLKVYRQPDGAVATFRPEANAAATAGRSGSQERSAASRCRSTAWAMTSTSP